MSTHSNRLQDRTIRYLWRRGHWSNTSRNAKPMSGGARVLADFLTVMPEFPSLYGTTSDYARNNCFDSCEKTKAYMINLDCCAKSRSSHCLVRTQLGKVKRGHEREDLNRKGGEQLHNPRVWQHCCTRWRAGVFRLLTNAHCEFLTMEFQFNSF